MSRQYGLVASARAGRMSSAFILKNFVFQSLKAKKRELHVWSVILSATKHLLTLGILQQLIQT